MTYSTKVLIAAPEGRFREKLCTLLSMTGEPYATHCVSDPIALLGQLTQRNPEVLLLSLEMPDMKTTELVPYLTEQYPSASIIAIGGQKWKSNAFRLFRLGIGALLAESEVEHQLTTAIRECRQYGYYMDRQTCRFMLKTIRQKSGVQQRKSLTTALTERECEVLLLICEEYSTREIADKLAIHKRTVDSHRRTIMYKLGARNVVGMVVKAIQVGIFQP